MKKAAITLFSSALLFSALASANTLSKRAQSIADRLEGAETQLDRRDARDIDMNLQQIEMILRSYGNSEGSYTKNLLCLSNGEYGSFEKFILTDARTNQKLGKGTSKELCKKTLSSTKNALICLSNGEHGSFEKFTVYNFRTQSNIGRETHINTCLSVVQRSTKSYMCASNGEHGSFEKFTLINLETGSPIGSGTSLENCLETIR